MPRLKQMDWLKARGMFESGASQVAVAEKYGVSRKAVQLKIDSEGWTQDLEGQIKRKVAEKLAGKLAGGDFKETVAAIGAEADRRVKIARRHEQLAEQATAIQQQAIGKQVNGVFVPDFNMQKSAKINSETVSILISLERKMYRLEDAPATPEATTILFAPYPDDL